MAVKRLGGGGTPSSAGGKLASITAAVQGNMVEVSKQLERPIDRSRGVFERSPLADIRPDPENPRNLNLTWDELTAGIQELRRMEEGATRNARQKIIESIAGMAASFKTVGQMHPIILYRDERGMLRIVDGERRYWAARVAEWKEIEAKIRPARPKFMRLEQYVANMQREDLSLSGHFNNLEMLLEEAENQGSQVKSLTEFSTLLGKPRATVQLYWSILRSDHEDVKQAIRNGSVTSLETAYAAAQEVDVGRRAALLEGHAVPPRNPAQSPSRTSSGAGRPKSAVELGRIKDLEIVRGLIKAVPLGRSFDDIDWGNPKEVQRAWRDFLEDFSKHLKKQAPLAQE